MSKKGEAVRLISVMHECIGIMMRNADFVVIGLGAGLLFESRSRRQRSAHNELGWNGDRRSQPPDSKSSGKYRATRPDFLIDTAQRIWDQHSGCV